MTREIPNPQTPRHLTNTSARFSYTHPIFVLRISVLGFVLIATDWDELRRCLLLNMQLLTLPQYSKYHANPWL